MIRACFIFVVLLSLSVCSTAAHAIGTSFTYQGELNLNGAPANGTYTLRFRLWTAETGGAQVGSTLTLFDANVVNGRITANLNFGSNAYAGLNRWLEIQVDGTVLSPRQFLSSSPFSIETRGLYVSPDESFVGVGRTSPVTSAEAFGIYKSTNTFGGMYIQTNALGRPFYGYSAGGDADAYHYVDGATGHWHFVNAGGFRVTIAANGDMGIGTQSPEHRLHVKSSASSSIYGETDKQDTVGGVGVRGVATNTALSSWGVWGESMSNVGTGVHGEGRWGVHGQSNSAVGAGVTASNFNSSGYDFNAIGDGINYGATSSRRWKRNIEQISDPLDKLAQLRGVYFDWDEDHGGHHDVGCIAEEVGEVLPEIVAYEANGIDAQGMDYSMLSPLLIEAVNALRAEKDAEIAELKAAHDQQIESLETRIRRLEALITQSKQ